jgi:glutamyl-Q tRNA(Asp) synthetase
MIVTRFAPSPTGLLHLGHAYSALFAYRVAAGGRFLLRIEDIDATRCRPEFVDAAERDLAWLGLAWERPVRRQSQHFADYAAALGRLRDRGLVYPCFCTRADIARSADAPHGPDGALYPGTCRHLGDDERQRRIAAGTPYALRLDVARAMRMTGPLAWFDLDAGEQVARPDTLGDVVLARKETPTSYHLAVTVDDALQGVTLVTRGTDLFHATHIHRLLQALLDLPVPQWRHHHLLLDDSGRRLAKRDRAATIAALREAGVTPADVRRRAGLPDA